MSQPNSNNDSIQCTPKAIKIGRITNHYGGLVAVEKNGKCYWGIEDCKETTWEEIPLPLFSEIIKHRRT